MNRYDLLKRLKDKISQLVAEGLDEETIFAQLHANPYFANVTSSEVHSLYKHLHEDIEFETEYERRIAELSSQMKRIKKSCQRSSNFLVYGYNHQYSNNVWQSRFVVTNQSERIEVRDLFHDKSKSFEPEVSGYIYAVYALAYPFLLLIVKDLEKRLHGDNIYYLHLARFDPESDKLQMVHRIQFEVMFDLMCFEVLVDTSDASKFVLITEQHAKAYKLVDVLIQIGKVLENFNLRSRTFASYCRDCIYDLKLRYDFDDDCYDLSEIEVKICDLERDKNEIIKLDSLPSNLSFVAQSRAYEVYDYKFNDFEWVHNCLFVSVKFQSIGSYGVAFTNLQKKGWTVINFASYSLIDQICFVSGKDFLISTYDSKTYKLPICKPEYLRNMAWLKLVNLSKQAGVKDPFDEARQYLPLNSDIQPFVFTEE